MWKIPAFFIVALVIALLALLPRQAHAQTVSSANLTIQVAGVGDEASPTRAQVIAASFEDTGMTGEDSTGTYDIFRMGNLFFAWRHPSSGNEGTFHEITDLGNTESAGGTTPTPQSFGTAAAISETSGDVTGITDTALPTGYSWVGEVIKGGAGSDDDDYRILRRAQAGTVTYYRVFASDADGTGNTPNQAREVATSALLNTVSVGNAPAPTSQDQFVLGNNKHHYTLPGLGAGNGNSRQRGTTQVVTTDTTGNLGTSPYTYQQVEEQTVGSEALTIKVRGQGSQMVDDSRPTRAQVLAAGFEDTEETGRDSRGAYHIFSLGNLLFAWRPPNTGTEGTFHELTVGGNSVAAGGRAPTTQTFGEATSITGIDGVTDNQLPSGFSWVSELIQGGAGSDDDYRILRRNQGGVSTYYRVFASGATGTGNTPNQARTVIGTMFLNTVSVGNSPVPTRNDQLILGNARHHYTLPGLGANNSQQSGRTWMVTTDASGNLGRTEIPPPPRGPNDDQFEAGVAAAIALAGIQHTYGTDFAVGGSLGFFESGVALAWQLSWMPMENLLISAGGAHGVTESGNGGHISATFGF